MSSIIEEIKSRLNIVDVAQGYLKLEKAGGNFKACCPFHNEHTPSFFISPARQTYHCFGCNRGGDVISFVEDIEGLDFSGALKVLAERAGVELKREKTVSKETRDEREMLYRTLELTTKFYEAVLPKFPDAVAYLHDRGLTDETIKNFRIGFAPDEWRSLGDFLEKKGISEQTMEQGGLIVRSPKGFYDRFRGRVMFPLTDSSGRVIAFSGRILKEGEGKTLGVSASAKYVNSPETEVFHKSRTLFGFYQAKGACRSADACVLVEGQMDLVLSHQAGVTNTVALSGTALTALHLTLIKRFTKNLVLAFDADDAGLRAAHRAIGLALSQDMVVRIAKLSRGMDPADLARKDPVSWQTVVREAKQVIDFYLELLPEIHSDKDILRAKVSEIIIPFIAEQRSSIDQGYYVGQVAKLLGIKEDPVWDEVKKRGTLAGIERSAETPNQLTGHQSRVWTRSSAVDFNGVPLSRRLRIVRTIEGGLLWQESSKEPVVADIKKYRARLEKLQGKTLDEQASESPPSHDELIFEAEARFHGNEHIEEELNDLLRTLEEEILRDRFTQKMTELKESETKGNIEEAQKILAECQAISKELQTLTAKKL